MGKLPDLAAVINEAALAGISEADIEVAVRVLHIAIDRLHAFITKRQNT